MTVIVPASGGVAKVTVLETTKGGRVIVQENGSSVERSVDLNVMELRQLADHLQRIARRVARRPEYRP